MHDTPIVPDRALVPPASAEGASLRDDLLVAYGGVCAISGCDISATLVVTLIDPAQPPEPANALLLRADIGLLFTAGLLAVDAITLKVHLAPALAASEYVTLIERTLHQPVRAGLRPSRRALDEHHQRFADRYGLPFRPATPSNAEAQPADQPATAPTAPQQRGRPVPGHVLQVKSLVNSVAFSSDGALLATGSWDGVTRLWRSADGHPVQILSAELGEVNSVSFSPDGRLVAAAGRNHSVQLWRTADGSPLFALAGAEGHQGAVFGVAFSPDGQLVASGSWDRSVRLWRASDGSLANTLGDHRGAVNCVAFSPTGRHLASGSHDRLVRLWRPSDGALLQTLQGHGDAVFSVAFSPDGRLLASAGTDQTIRLWRVADGAVLFALPVQRGAIFSLAFSPDGKTLISGDYGRAVRLWRVHDGTLLHTLGGHGEGITSVAASPDGRQLASGSFDATVRLWELGG